MLGKLKDLASAGAVEKAIGAVEPIVREHLSKATSLSVASLRDDASYGTHVVRPAYLALAAAVSGATKLIPQFEERFTRLMHALRDELLVVEGETVRLVEDYQSRIQTVLVTNLKG